MGQGSPGPTCGPQAGQAPEKLESAQAAPQSAGWTTTWQPRAGPPPQASGRTPREAQGPAAPTPKQAWPSGPGRHSQGTRASTSFTPNVGGRADAAASPLESTPALRGCHHVETALQASVSPHQGPKGWADHREARNRTPGSWSKIPASRKALRPPGTPQLTVEHSGCSGPTDSPPALPTPPLGDPQSLARPIPQGRPLQGGSSEHPRSSTRGQAGRVSRGRVSGTPRTSGGASARGLLTSCGVDASSDTGAGHQAGPTATRGPSPAATEEKQVLARQGRWSRRSARTQEAGPAPRARRQARWLQGTRAPGPQAASGAPGTPRPAPPKPQLGARDQGSHGPLMLSPAAHR